MLNKEQLDEIKARVEKATPGEWFYDSYTVCTDEVFDDEGNLVETVTLDYADRHGDVHFKKETDAQFVAHARQDVPALIEEVERLNRIEKIALHFMERETKLQNAITQALEVVSDAEGELIERVEQVLLDALEGDDACL